PPDPDPPLPETHQLLTPATPKGDRPDRTVPFFPPLPRTATPSAPAARGRSPRAVVPPPVPEGPGEKPRAGEAPRWRRAARLPPAHTNAGARGHRRCYGPDSAPAVCQHLRRLRVP